MHLHPSPIRRFLSTPFFLTCLCLAAFSAWAGDTFKWNVQYLVDNSQEAFGRSQKVWPRRNRGIALSPDGKYLYLGYHHGGNNQGEVRKVAVGITDDYARATFRVLQGPLGKALACDDKGRVYIADEGKILIYDENLDHLEFSIPTPLCEGVCTVRESGNLVLYGSDRQLGCLTRWEIEEKGDVVAGATRAGLDGTGQLYLEGATSLRNVEVDPNGNIWVADNEGGRIYRVSKDGKKVDKVEMSMPFDVAFEGTRAYVTRSKECLVSVLDMETMKLIGNLSVPWDELELSPSGNNRIAGLSGIVTIPGKGFFVANESGQTGNQKSTYGRADEHTDVVGGKLFRDAYMDDNDPVLRALEVSVAE
jgi:DNA-binding beta-propeller fold protein YncE